MFNKQVVDISSLSHVWFRYIYYNDDNIHVIMQENVNDKRYRTTHGMGTRYFDHDSFRPWHLIVLPYLLLLRVVLRYSCDFLYEYCVADLASVLFCGLGRFF